MVADDSYSNIEIRTIRAADGIYLLTGKVGNIGLSAGTDGVFLIDDQFAPLTERILAAIGELSTSRSGSCSIPTGILTIPG